MRRRSPRLAPKAGLAAGLGRGRQALDLAHINADRVGQDLDVLCRAQVARWLAPADGVALDRAALLVGHVVDEPGQASERVWRPTRLYSAKIRAQLAVAGQRDEHIDRGQPDERQGVAAVAAAGRVEPLRGAGLAADPVAGDPRPAARCRPAPMTVSIICRTVAAVCGLMTRVRFEAGVGAPCRSAPVVDSTSRGGTRTPSLATVAKTDGHLHRVDRVALAEGHRVAAGGRPVAGLGDLAGLLARQAEAGGLADAELLQVGVEPLEVAQPLGRLDRADVARLREVPA